MEDEDIDEEYEEEDADDEDEDEGTTTTIITTRCGHNDGHDDYYTVRNILLMIGLMICRRRWR